MGTGIIMCGLNGAGKSTLGRALADKLRDPQRNGACEYQGGSREISGRGGDKD